MKTKPVVALLCGLACASALFAQQGPRKFGWIRANDETARLDPANYYGGRTYHPSAGGGNLHVDIKAQQPVTIFMARAGEWSSALQRPGAMATIQELCPRTHVTETTFTCFISEPMTLVVQDERASTGKTVVATLGAALDQTYAPAARVASVGLAAMLSGGTPAKRHFTAPNDVHVQYYRWDCIENCVQPEFQWIRVANEQYKLTPYMKIYSGYTPDLDGEQVSVFIKAPVPMVVALIPSSVAAQLHENRQTLESVLDKVSCQQRAVQKLQFQCTFNVADGPQSLVVVPENDDRVPHKKTDVDWQADKCVANCPAPQQPAEAQPAAAQPAGTQPSGSQNPQNPQN
jgi:hypothetical protein